MTSKAAFFALLAMWGVGSTACLPAFAEDTPTESVVNAKTASAIGVKIAINKSAGKNCHRGSSALVSIATVVETIVKTR